MDLENLPSQIDSAAPASCPPGKKRRGRRAADPLEASQKLGQATVGKSKASFMKSFFERRRLLTVPREIIDANPDKHFCFVNMNKLQKNGMWHPQGYRLYNVKTDPENQFNEKFNNGIDNYVHRNEMVLAYIPVEEFEERRLEFDIARGKRDMTELITKDPNLSGFHPHAKEEEQRLPFPSEQKN